MDACAFRGPIQQSREKRSTELPALFTGYAAVREAARVAVSETFAAHVGGSKGASIRAIAFAIAASAVLRPAAFAHLSEVAGLRGTQAAEFLSFRACFAADNAAWERTLGVHNV